MGLFVAGASLSGCGGAAFSTAWFYTWKRPPHYPIKCAAMSFLKNKITENQKYSEAKADSLTHKVITHQLKP